MTVQSVLYASYRNKLTSESQMGMNRSQSLLRGWPNLSLDTDVGCG